MIPIYSIASLLSYIFYNHALYFQLARDCYEAFVISSFFNLLLAYLSAAEPLDHIFRRVHLEHWMFPLGWIKSVLCAPGLAWELC